VRMGESVFDRERVVALCGGTSGIRPGTLDPFVAKLRA
jgi:hypothetical protein